MRQIPRHIVEKFVIEFAATLKSGFSAKQITDFFGEYSLAVKPHDHYGVNLSRKDLFIESFYVLEPKKQYYCLNDLCNNPPEMRYNKPTEEVRERLFREFHEYIGPTPIGLKMSALREDKFNEDWFKAYNRIVDDPNASITSARTLLENTLKKIIMERGVLPNNSGDLGKLLKQVIEVLGIKQEKQEHQMIVSGISSITNAVAALSNKDGDRHGSVESIGNPKILAPLVLNLCGSIGIYFIELHLFSNI